MVRAPLSGALRLRLVDVHGLPLPGQLVGALSADPPHDFGSWVEPTDENGLARIRGLTPGSLQVGVFHWMTSGGEKERDPVPVTVEVISGRTAEVMLKMRGSAR